MCHVCSLFQSCHDLQIFAHFFYSINMSVFLQIGCACNACCVYFFQFLAVGGYFGDLVAYLRVYCEVEGFAFVYGVGAFDCCCAYRIYGVINAVLAFYCCHACQIFCFHCICSCVCAVPDGYGVVCLTCQFAHQFNGVIFQELLVDAAIVICRSFGVVVVCRSLSRSFGCVIHQLAVFGLICCGGLVCDGLLGLVVSNGFFCLGGLRECFGFFLQSLCLGFSLSAVC